ncbi:MAG: ABC transporter permease [Lachnospiraceae bacterium]
MEKFKHNPLVKKIGFNRIVLCCVLILMYVVFVIASPTFLSYSRILSALNYAYFLGFLALGVTFVIGTGGIDFSIGPVMFCSALVSGQVLTQWGLPLIVCLFVSVLVGAMFGTLNGYLVAYWNVPSFITSMASMQISKGIGSVFTKTQSVSWPQSTDPNGWYRNLVKFRVGDFDIPTGLILLLIGAVICSIVLNKTKAGRYILCLGSNKEAVRLSGVNVKKWEMLAYIICGLLAGVAAIFFVGAYTTVQPGLGDQYNNEAIAGAVMGGTSMAGGLASIGGTVIGVMIIALLQEGILALGFTKDYQLVITGLIVIIAVFADILSRRRKN